jgi:hypothetical protein
MTTITNDQPPGRRRRNRRTALPSVSDVEVLISQARGLRLKLVELTSFQTLAEPARQAAENLCKAGQQLEHIIELVVSAKTRRRRSRKEKITSDKLTI